MFITANVKTRAIRRFKELRIKNRDLTFKEVLKSIKKRDKSDINRKISPLKKTKDSIADLEKAATYIDMEIKKLKQEALNPSRRGFYE